MDTGMDGSGVRINGSWAFEDDILFYRSVRYQWSQDSSEGSEEEIYTVSSTSSEGYYSD